MSSTDLAARRRKAGAFFDARVKPLMAATREAGGFFPLGPEPGLESYYQARQRRVMRREDFENGAFGTPEELAKQLAALWSAEGHRSLLPLAEPLGALARELRLNEEQTAEVSELIYVMF